MSEHLSTDPGSNESPATPIPPPDQPIVYHYLTHETHVPSPTQLNKNDVECLRPPELRKFESPFNWSKSRKIFITLLSCTITMITAYTAGAYSPPARQMSKYWDASHMEVLVGITTFTTGFSIAPMVLAPFSELNGRRPVFIATGILFVAGQVGCATTTSYGGMLAARFFTGVGGSTFATMVGGVISDIYHYEDRNMPMCIFSGGSLFGMGFGPLVSGLIVHHLDWRWVFYVQVIDSALLILAVAVFFNETRGSVLLSNKAKVLNSWYAKRERAGLFGFDMPTSIPGETESQRIRWKVKADEERDSFGKMIAISCCRPFHLLLTEPVVFYCSLWVGFAWALLYLSFLSVPLIIETIHHLNVEQTAAVYTAICVAAILGTILNISLENLARRYCKISSTPEGRLYFCGIQSTLLPIGLFWFGATSSPIHHWIHPALSIGCATMGVYSIYLSVFNYLTDTYHRYSSSALAAQSFARNMLGGIFALIARPMYARLGFIQASCLLGGISVVLTTVPWVMLIWGHKIRARSKFAKDLAKS